MLGIAVFHCGSLFLFLGMAESSQPVADFVYVVEEKI
jgi:hypothetical protein